MGSFEKLLIDHSAPTLLGVKQANLFSFTKAQYKEFCNEIAFYNTVLNTKDIYIEYLYQYAGRIFVIVYRRKQLLAYLTNAKVAAYLKKQGYPRPISSLEPILRHLKKRTNKRLDFPHEIGFFLGYPPEDVFEFINQKGRNYKLCGYWKVYSNEEKAKQTFLQYKKCKDLLLVKANAGIPIYKLFASVS